MRIADITKLLLNVKKLNVKIDIITLFIESDMDFTHGPLRDKYIFICSFLEEARKNLNEAILVMEDT